jgi:hypothetical protein
MASKRFKEIQENYTAEHGGKPWKYALIPHDQVRKTNTLKGVISNNIYKN